MCYLEVRPKVHQMEDITQKVVVLGNGLIPGVALGQEGSVYLPDRWLCLELHSWKSHNSVFLPVLS